MRSGSGIVGLGSSREGESTGWKCPHLAASRKRLPLRSFFRPVTTVRLRVESFLERIRPVKGFLVGIHIRQGDYREFRGGAYYMDTSRYTSYMHRIEALLDRPARLIVCSDTHQDIKRFEGLDVYLGPGSIVDEALHYRTAISGSTHS